MAFDQNRYIQEYSRANYDRITLRIPKGTKVEIADYAKARGLSVNALILKALRDCYGFDFRK